MSHAKAGQLVVQKAMRNFRFVFRIDGFGRDAVNYSFADHLAAKDFALAALQSKVPADCGVGTVSVGELGGDDIRPVLWLGSWELQAASDASWSPWIEDQPEALP